MNIQGIGIRIANKIRRLNKAEHTKNTIKDDNIDFYTDIDFAKNADSYATIAKKYNHGYYILNRPLDVNAIQKFKIANLKILDNNSLRGETLSSKRNRWALSAIKQSGIESVIDLRDKYRSENYLQMCKHVGLKYYHFPIDSSTTPDEVIINNFPSMFKIINKGRYYIACAQGLHRTDIALALNYVFNPKKNEIPQMYGHLICNMDISDITRRINSINKKIKDKELSKLGWKSNARDEILQRKNKLVNSFKADKEKMQQKSTL